MKSSLSINVMIKCYSTLFIQQVKDAKFPFNEINARLIVMEVDEWPSNLFTHVFLLFQLEHVLQQSQYPPASLNTQQTVHQRTVHSNASVTHIKRRDMLIPWIRTQFFHLAAPVIWTRFWHCYALPPLVVDNSETGLNTHLFLQVTWLVVTVV